MDAKEVKRSGMHKSVVHIASGQAQASLSGGHGFALFGPPKVVTSGYLAMNGIRDGVQFFAPEVGTMARLQRECPWLCAETSLISERDTIVVGVQDHQLSGSGLIVVCEPEALALGVVAPPSGILEGIGEKTRKGQTLLFDDLAKIARALELLYDQADLVEILMILDRDVQLRKQIFHDDCIEELYRDNDLLPEEMRVARPRRDNNTELIQERIRAILVHEYRRLHRLAGLDFINREITYNEYVERTRRYAVDASRLYPR